MGVLFVHGGRGVAGAAHVCECLPHMIISFPFAVQGTLIYHRYIPDLLIVKYMNKKFIIEA